MLRSAQRLRLVLGSAFHPFSDHELEHDECDEAERCTRDVDQPEGRGRQARIEATDIADHCIRDEEGQDNKGRLPSR